MAETRFVAKSGGLIQTDIGGQVLIYNPEQEQFHALAGSAADIWRLLDATNSVDDVESRLGTMYATVESEALHQDISGAVDQMETLHLLTPVQGAGVRGYDMTCQPGSLPHLASMITSYDADWMRQNHPGAFYQLGYGDFWGPGKPGAIPIFGQGDR